MTNAADVVADRLWIHDLHGTGVYAAPVGEPTGVVIRRSWIEGATTGGAVRRGGQAFVQSRVLTWGISPRNLDGLLPARRDCRDGTTFAIDSAQLQPAAILAVKTSMPMGTIRVLAKRFTRLAAVATVLGGSASATAAPSWSFHGQVVAGGQLDAVRGPNDRIHVIASRYYQLDGTGAVLVDEAQGDGRQGALDFPPAIAVAADGSVHIVTRHGGDFANGHDIRYRRRNPQGGWDRDYWVGTPAKRNYGVAIAWAGSQVVLASSHCGAEIWGDLHLFEAGPSAAAPIGDLAGIWRADADYRMRGYADRVMLVAGVCDPSGTVFFGCGAAGGNLVDQVTSSLHSHTAGTGRRAWPDVYVDAFGGVHMTYGGAGQVYYARHDVEGNEQSSSDRLVFDGLGGWSLQAGLSAVAASDTGNVVVAVALSGDESDLAADSDLWWSYSTDGGESWAAPEDMGRNTHGGAGRRRPRLVAIGNTFHLLYWDNAESGLAMASVVVQVDDDEDGYPDGEDCNDGDDSIHPEAIEICNGVDDDCDGETDEGCGAPDGGADAGLGMGGAGGDMGSGGEPSSTGGGLASQATVNGGLYGHCGCRMAGGASERQGGYWLAVFLALALWRRRWRGRRRRQR